MLLFSSFLLFFPVPDPIKLGSVGKSNPTGTLLKKASRKSYSIRLAPRTGPDSFNLVLRSGYTERPS